MKNYEIIASKEVVATFRMNVDLYHIKFLHSGKMAEFIVKKHPELANSIHSIDFEKEEVVLKFYSVGNLIIQEK